MSVYVDHLSVAHIPGKRGKRWCHMIADTHQELRDMADALRLNPQWIQAEGRADEHFDLSPGRRGFAVSRGALEMSTRDLVRIILKKREDQRR